MTPFAAYITLKKSVQKDLSGTPAVPSPPLLFLLQSAQQENLQLREENFRLKAACEMQQGKLDNIVQEKEGLESTIEENNKTVKALNETINNLHSDLSIAETKLKKFAADKEDSKAKAKNANKKQYEEAVNLKAQIEALNKNLKAKDKITHDLSKNLDNARNTIKNLKSEKSLLKVSKTKLEGEIRKLEKNVRRKMFTTMQFITLLSLNLKIVMKTKMYLLPQIPCYFPPWFPTADLILTIIKDQQTFLQ